MPSLNLFIWRLICRFAFGAHVRDWPAWDEMGIARCLHCRKPMPEPDWRRPRL